MRCWAREEEESARGRVSWPPRRLRSGRERQHPGPARDSPSDGRGAGVLWPDTDRHCCGKWLTYCFNKPEGTSFVYGLVKDMSQKKKGKKKSPRRCPSRHVPISLSSKRPPVPASPCPRPRNKGGSGVGAALPAAACRGQHPQASVPEVPGKAWRRSALWALR